MNLAPAVLTALRIFEVHVFAIEEKSVLLAFFQLYAEFLCVLEPVLVKLRFLLGRERLSDVFLVYFVSEFLDFFRITGRNEGILRAIGRLGLSVSLILAVFQISIAVFEKVPRVFLGCELRLLSRQTLDWLKAILLDHFLHIGLDATEERLDALVTLGEIGCRNLQRVLDLPAAEAGIRKSVEMFDRPFDIRFLSIVKPCRRLELGRRR
ncbi:hypothetical protein [Hoeflea halophila]|uniref:hypothetical protein n=1 Tax=Hoeflea halophila TaxID=714899 RepID=UPI0015CB0ED7|nr:hypothetical protein [Hoeflea halophila]